MSINLNDLRANMSEEYPSHMREEEPDDEVFESGDHGEEDEPTAQEEQVAAEEVIEDETDSISENQQAYEGLTEDRLRQVVEDVLGEADPEIVEAIREEEAQPQLRQIDVSMIPPGMSTEDYIRQYQQLGTSITQATGIPTSHHGTATDASDGQGFVTSDGTDAAQPTLLKSGEMDFGKMMKEVEKVETPPLTPEEIAELKAAKRKAQIAALKYKMIVRIRDLNISKDDLIVSVQRSYYTFYHTDANGEYSLDSPSDSGVRRPRRLRGGGQNISSLFIFDKNMNRLYVDNAKRDHKDRTLRDGTRIYSNQVGNLGSRGPGDEEVFVIIDKKAFIQSKGRIWKLKRKQGISYKRIIQTKRHFMEMFAKVERFLTWMKSSIEQVHPEEDYDIMYVMQQNDSQNNEFSLLLRFRDINISNSIEMEHHIGDMIIKSGGTHRVSHGGIGIRATLTGQLRGTRMTFTPGDAAMNYQHSHMTTTMANFQGFCTGSVSYNHGEGYMTDIELQAHIFKLTEFVSWESLEGGPHYRMENINLHGNVITIEKNIMGVGRETSDRYVERLIHEINLTPERFATFSNCFTLVNTNGTLRFVADYHMFFRKFIEVLGNDKIRRIHEELREKLYTYKTDQGTFHKIRDYELTQASYVIRKARINMKSLTPVYMNGKYHRPRLSTLDTKDVLEGMVFSLEPNVMKEIAQLIMYHLTNKLEEYGNSSTS